jgi:assimilatory nitrate reductase catalytic subunit
MSEQTVKTTCPYCGVGCGVLMHRSNDGSVRIEGDADHPANFGRLCSKGSALGETLGLEQRLLRPLINGRQASWDKALDVVAQRFSQTINQYGPDSVAFYVSGQLLTEDYYLANKLMKGFIGSANIDTNSRLCMSSAVAAHKRTFGADTVPGCYEDLELADVVVLWGSNMAWCHPVLYQRLEVAKIKRPEMKIILIDPRRTATAELCDLHLSIRPGQDTVLLNGLLAHLQASGKRDEQFVAAHTNGIEEALKAAGTSGIAEIAHACGLEAPDVESFYYWFAAHEKSMSVYSQGVTMSSSGTDKVNAILNCHLLTGRIGKPGMGPFSLTGQPNAMGGREVGGLANQLAAHMELNNADQRRIVQDFWASPHLPDKPGLKAVELFQAIGGGRIKAIWIMATNPVVSLPEANVVRRALQNCPFVVVSDVARHTDTTELAHVLLPAASWGEKDGTVTNSERRISRQRQFVPAPGVAQPDWWIIAQVAQRMGFENGFKYSCAAEIFAEHIELSGRANTHTRAFDLSALLPLSSRSYDSMTPFQWPLRKGEKMVSNHRLYADGRFFTTDRKARFVPTPPQKPKSAYNTLAPLILNTGRIRDQWHTMTRTGNSPRLSSHLTEPFVEIHGHDARQANIEDNTIVRLKNQHGSVLARAHITNSVQPGSVFMPIHWSNQYASAARVDVLVTPHCDPVSGQPESKHARVEVSRYPARWHAFAISAQRPNKPDNDYWVTSCCTLGWRLEMADKTEPANLHAYVRRLFDLSQGQLENGVMFHDKKNNRTHLAFFKGDRLVAALFCATTPVTVARTWADQQLGETFDNGVSRLHLLAALPGQNQPDTGAIICSCFSVGKNQITQAITTKGCTTVDAIGTCLQAGTNCGSCRSEIKKLIAENTAAQESRSLQVAR